MVNYQYATALHNAAAICDVEALLRCLTPEALAACPIDTRDRDELESTALHALCRYAREYREDESRRVDDRNADIEVCLQLLVEAGADLEARDKLGCSPLQVLAWFSIVKFRTEATLRLTSLLLRHGANGGFLAFELDIALFAAARDPATARRRMDSLRWLLLRRVRVRRTRIPLPARARSPQNPSRPQEKVNLGRPSIRRVLRRVGDAPDGSAAIPPGFRPAPARAARS